MFSLWPVANAIFSIIKFFSYILAFKKLIILIFSYFYLFLTLFTFLQSFIYCIYQQLLMYKLLLTSS